jgi:DNA-binding NtrC family response regulator
LTQACPALPERADRTDPRPVAESPVMREVLRTLEEVAPTPTTVLLLGAPATGRSRLGRFLHARSGRQGPCLELRCQAAAEAAPAALRGAVAASAGGTLLLREVGALPVESQAVLARALQDRQLDGEGSVRVVSTATPDLAARAAARAFRSDLFYRLDVFPIAVPALCERPEDLPGLAASILAEDAELRGVAPRTLSPGALDALRAHPCPGNVDELRELLRRGTRCAGGTLSAADLFGAAASDTADFPEELPLDLALLERLAILEALRRVRGNRTQAARLLHIGLRTLRNKLRAWREAGEEVIASPRARPELPAPAGPGAAETAAILARSWARRSQERSA